MPADAKVGFGVDRQEVWLADHRDAAAVEDAGEGQFADAFGQGHDGGDGHRRRPADEDVHPQPLLAADGRGVVRADAALKLIVQPDLAVVVISPAGQLHAIHSQVRAIQPGLVGVLGVNLRQGDVGAAVVGPTRQLRQPVQGRLLCQHGAARHPPRAGVPSRPGRPQIKSRTAQGVGRIDLQGDQPADGVQRVAEDVAHPLHRAEEVGEHGKLAVLGGGEQDGRPAGAKQPPLDFGHLQVRINRLVDDDQLPPGPQVQNAVAKSSIAHNDARSMVKIMRSRRRPRMNTDETQIRETGRS